MPTMKQTIKKKHSLKSIGTDLIGKFKTWKRSWISRWLLLTNWKLCPGQEFHHVRNQSIHSNYIVNVGVPEVRGTIWSLLSDYIPIDQEIADDTLTRKREEYIGMVRHYFEGAAMETTVQDLANKVEDMSSYETLNFKQIKIDVYRTQPEVELFSSQQMQTMLIRILFAWTMRHPASAYVQGINDLAAPMVLVFLTAAVAAKQKRDQQIQV